MLIIMKGLIIYDDMDDEGPSIQGIALKATSSAAFYFSSLFQA